MIGIKKLFGKLFVGGRWYVGYRNLSNDNSRYEMVDVPAGQWVADPFLYEYGDKHYLFVEQYIEQKQRAFLGVYEFVDGKPINNKIIIENDYHMSYPCVFNYKGKHYIIPESSANNTIDLYEASNFPYNWAKRTTLLQGEKYVDSTVYFQDNDIYLLTYKSEKSCWKLVVFQLDMGSLRLTRLCEKKYEKNTGRPAGFLYKEGKLYRPSQDCRNKYGEALIINEIDNIGSAGFEEHPISYISYKNITAPIDIQRIHTFNRDSKYEVVDLFEEKFDLFHAFRILKRKYAL